MLDRPVTANFHEPAPLAKILAFLAEAAGSDILIDRAALAAAETSDRVEATLTVEKQGLGAALTALLRPLGLTYRAIGANTIQVTTKEAAEERLELEFYPVGPWLDKGIAGPKLAEGLKARVAASTWSDAGGLADACFDPPSRCSDRAPVAARSGDHPTAAGQRSAVADAVGRDRSIFGQHSSRRRDFSPKNGPVPDLPVNAYP